MNFKAIDLFARNNWMKFTTLVIAEDTNSNSFVYETIAENVIFKMVSLFLLLGCYLSCINDLFDALHELASARTRTLLKLASSVRALA